MNWVRLGSICGLLLSLCACGGTSGSTGSGSTGAATTAGTSGGATTGGNTTSGSTTSGTSGTTGSSAGFNYSLDGQQFSSQSPVTISAVQSSGVYQGYFQARSAQSTTPNILVSIHEPSATLSQGATYSCARATGSDQADETSVLLHDLIGTTYYTNVLPSPSCTVTITAASQTSVSMTVTGTTYDEADSSLAPHSFTAAFTAAVQ